MKAIAGFIAVLSITAGLVYGTIPELTIPDLGTTVVDPCIRDRPECSLVKLLSELAWNLGQLLGIQYVSYGDFWKLLGCECKTIGIIGTLKCGSKITILNNCPCYGCIALDTKK